MKHYISNMFLGIPRGAHWRTIYNFAFYAKSLGTNGFNIISTIQQKLHPLQPNKKSISPFAPSVHRNFSEGGCNEGSRTKIILLFLLFTLNIYSADNPLLAVAIMVKNEALVLEKTLEPFVQAGVTQFLVYDTGSTDGTPEVAQRFFNEHQLTDTLIVKEPFIDFATSRNNALKVAEKRFCLTTFIMMPDAEWYLNDPQALKEFCTKERDTQTTAYMMLVHNKKERVHRPCLFKRAAHVRFKGSVHEYIQVPVDIVPDSISFIWGTSEKGREKTGARFIQDRDCLLKSYAKNPHDGHTLFFLGQTYSCLKDHHNAYIFYEKAFPVASGDENKFETLYRLGLEVEELSKTDTHYTWRMAQDYYLRAYSLRPKRPEPLVRIAGYYIQQKQHALAFIFARHACELPMPAGELNFVEVGVYTFDRYAALSTCAWAAHEYAAGLWAAEKALAVRPDVDYLYDHMIFYKDKLGVKK